MTQERGEIPRSEWQHFFDQQTKVHEGAEVSIEVLSLDFGDQHEVERLPLASLTYDPKDDVVIVAVGGRDGRYPVVLRHFIDHPQQILGDPSVPGTVYALEVVGADDTRTITTLFPGSDREESP